MLKRVEYPIVYVSDVRRAVTFYVEVLGFSVDDDSVDFVVLSLGDSRVALNLVDNPEKKPGSQTILLSSDDIASDFERIKGLARIILPLSETDYGKTFFFSDPDGNKIEVVE